MRLFAPGPVQLPEPVVQAMARQPLHHHSDEFAEVCRRCFKGLEHVFFTTLPVLLLNGSGTTGIEAAITNLHERNTEILVFENGRFGERISQIAERNGIVVHRSRHEWGSVVTPEHVVQAIRKHHNASAVWFVHSETSTGVTLSLDELVSALRDVRPDVLVCVDAVTSIGVHPLFTEEWHLDAVITASQKGLLSPPGLSAIWLSERAWSIVERNTRPSYSTDLLTIRSAYRQDQFVWTPPVTLVAALATAVELLLTEGLPRVWDRHYQQASLLRSGLIDRGYHLFGEATSNAVTAVRHDSPEAIRRFLLENYSMVVAPGQGKLRDSIFRIGTCGAITKHDIMDVLAALEDVPI